jgi:hypothetical protein
MNQGNSSLDLATRAQLSLNATESIAGQEAVTTSARVVASAAATLPMMSSAT